jgi:hypothetical protein
MSQAFPPARRRASIRRNLDFRSPWRSLADIQDVMQDFYREKAKQDSGAR